MLSFIGYWVGYTLPYVVVGLLMSVGLYFVFGKRIRLSVMVSAMIVVMTLVFYWVNVTIPNQVKEMQSRMRQ